MEQSSLKNRFTGDHNSPGDKFPGQYTNQGGNYYQNSTSGILVKLCQRKEPNALKPLHYLVENTGGKFTFLTSLYPQSEPEIYQAEINRKYYSVSFTGDTLNVRQK